MALPERIIDLSHSGYQKSFSSIMFSNLFFKAGKITFNSIFEVKRFELIGYFPDLQFC